ncbi:hypothetical protein WICPIJ_008911 [Wickerhamomyces pijperi]|uniref:Uncharacterized protein n=1 Tax=Wickerhamomyces pijperi TaxID=599730 RepID=A0A9P8PTV1_WICPI|nr:hypothetical protein WICPIJ_008911 [Wickerhamomyces pijperi]
MVLWVQFSFKPAEPLVGSSKFLMENGKAEAFFLISVKTALEDFNFNCQSIGNLTGDWGGLGGTNDDSFRDNGGKTIDLDT